MMTIVHRINTILTSDKVIVMDQGRVAEFGDTTQLAATRVPCSRCRESAPRW